MKKVAQTTVDIILILGSAAALIAFQWYIDRQPLIRFVSTSASWIESSMGVFGILDFITLGFVVVGLVSSVLLLRYSPRLHRPVKIMWIE